MLDRVARGALAVCVVLASAAWLIAGGAVALGVLGGGLVSGLSLWAIRSGAGAFLTGDTNRNSEPAQDPSPDRGRPRRLRRRALARLVGRYALLGFLAYVMIARLRLHPIGLLLGASSVVVAASIETVRLLARRGAH